MSCFFCEFFVVSILCLCQLECTHYYPTIAMNVMNVVENNEKKEWKGEYGQRMNVNIKN